MATADPVEELPDFGGDQDDEEAPAATAEPGATAAQADAAPGMSTAVATAATPSPDSAAHAARASVAGPAPATSDVAGLAEEAAAAGMSPEMLMAMRQQLHVASGQQIPPPEEEILPADGHMESWLELLRDGYIRQLRELHEYPEPPVFHRAYHFVANPAEGVVMPGKYPRDALDNQLNLLYKQKTEAGSRGGGKGKGKEWSGDKGGGKKGAVAALAQALQANPAVQQLVASLQGAAPGNLLLEAAKALGTMGGEGKGWGKGGKFGKSGKGKGKGKGKGDDRRARPY